MSAEIAIEVHRETRYWNLNLLEVAFEFVHNPDGIKKVFNLRNIRPQIHFFCIIMSYSWPVHSGKKNLSLLNNNKLLKLQISYDIEIRIANIFCEINLCIAVHF